MMFSNVPDWDLFFGGGLDKAQGTDPPFASSISVPIRHHFASAQERGHGTPIHEGFFGEHLQIGINVDKW